MKNSLNCGFKERGMRFLQHTIIYQASGGTKIIADLNCPCEAFNIRVNHPFYLLGRPFKEPHFTLEESYFPQIIY